MSDIFDLSGVSRLVDNHQPSRVMILDTNVFMNHPDHTGWGVATGGRSVFVLSDTLIQELEFVSRKDGTKAKIQSRAKAQEAIRRLAELLKQGTITEGIAIEQGWVIGIPSPLKAILDPALEELEDIVRAFQRSDAKLLLLTRQCHEMYKSTPVTLLTGEVNFFNVVQMQGVPCHLWTGFPVQALREATAAAKAVDWDQVLGELMSDVKDRAIAVEVTLTARRLAPSWLTTGARSFMIAEGCGVIRTGAQIRTFLWTLPYYPLRLQPPSGGAGGHSVDLPLMHLDFLGEDDLGQDLFDAIADRISDCTALLPDDEGPTIHSPRSVMEMLAYFEYLSDEGPSQHALGNLLQEIHNADGLAGYWTDWLRTMRSAEDRYASLRTLMDALVDCWEIGETHTFSVIMGQ